MKEQELEFFLNGIFDLIKRSGINKALKAAEQNFDPIKEPFIFHNMGVFLLKKDKVEMAREFFKKGFGSAGDNEPLKYIHLLDIAGSYRFDNTEDEDVYREAIKYTLELKGLNEKLKNDNDKHLIFYYMGFYSVMLEDFDNAKDYLKKAIDHHPKDDNDEEFGWYHYYHALSLMESENADIKKAIAALNSALELFKANSDDPGVEAVQELLEEFN